MSTTVSMTLLSYYLIQSYLLIRQICYTSATDVFLGNLRISQKQPPQVFYGKSCLSKILQYSQESCRPATLLKRDSNTDVFL